MEIAKVHSCWFCGKQIDPSSYGAIEDDYKTHAVCRPGETVYPLVTHRECFLERNLVLARPTKWYPCPVDTDLIYTGKHFVKTVRAHGARRGWEVNQTLKKTLADIGGSYNKHWVVYTTKSKIFLANNYTLETFDNLRAAKYHARKLMFASMIMVEQ